MPLRAWGVVELVLIVAVNEVKNFSYMLSMFPNIYFGRYLNVI